MTDHAAGPAARALLRELNDAMKSPRGDYYQGDIADPHRALHIVERHLDAAVAAAVAEENQACADLVGQWAMLESRHVVSHVLDKLATAIRARYRTRPAPGRRAG